MTIPKLPAYMTTVVLDCYTFFSRPRKIILKMTNAITEKLTIHEKNVYGYIEDLT